MGNLSSIPPAYIMKFELHYQRQVRRNAWKMECRHRPLEGLKLVPDSHIRRSPVVHHQELKFLDVGDNKLEKACTCKTYFGLNSQLSQHNALATIYTVGQHMSGLFV